MGEAVLETRGLEKSFGALRASRAVSLSLRRGEVHALIGPNGAGKTTLIGQITGAIRPDAGSVHFLGRDVTRLGRAARARAGLGRSFQISALAPEHTALQSVLLGALATFGGRPSLWRAPLAHERAVTASRDALERVGLSGRSSSRVSDLSHGERRLVELAAALAMGPRAFVLDEPMAGLGLEGSARLLRLLDGLRHEAPILLVEHDMDAVFALADRITVLVDGAVIASGGVEAIRGDPAVRRAYLGETA